MKSYFESLTPWQESAVKSGLPVYIYGMGNGAEKILELCSKVGVRVEGIFASDGFVRGQSFCGHRVVTLSQAQAERGRLCVLLGFGTDLTEVMERIEQISEEHMLLAPDVSVIGNEAFYKDRFLEEYALAERAASLLSDEQSREVFREVTAYKITGDLGHLRKVFSEPKKDLELLGLGDDEIYCDLGAYNGDTVLEFAEHVGRYRQIYAVEPEKRNFQKCVRRCRGLDKVTFVNAAAWDRDCELSFSGGSGRQAKIGSGNGITSARSLDSILCGRDCTYIKYDVEGADVPALMGSTETLSRSKPKLRCAVYHRSYDYVTLPLLIDRLCPGYKMFLRQSPYYPAWETELYAVWE